MSAFGAMADMKLHCEMSAYDPKRTGVAHSCIIFDPRTMSGPVLGANETLRVHIAFRRRDGGMAVRCSAQQADKIPRVAFLAPTS
jgi:hypothetical protein